MYVCMSVRTCACIYVSMRIVCVCENNLLLSMLSMVSMLSMLYIKNMNFIIIIAL